MASEWAALWPRARPRRTWAKDSLLYTTFISDEGTAGKGQTRTERENKKTKKHPEDVREGAGQELEAAPRLPHRGMSPLMPLAGCTLQTLLGSGKNSGDAEGRAPRPLASHFGPPAFSYLPGDPRTGLPRPRPLPSLPPPHFTSPPPGAAAMSVTGSSEATCLLPATTEVPADLLNIRTLIG